MNLVRESGIRNSHVHSVHPKLPRHLRTNKHKGDCEVKQLLALDENEKDTAETKERKKKMGEELLEQFGKRGTHAHNMRVLKKKVTFSLKKDLRKEATNMEGLFTL